MANKPQRPPVWGKAFMHICACLCLLASAPVNAQDAETLQSSSDFRAAFQRNDYAEIERTYTAYVSESRRSPRGVHLADTYPDFAEVETCRKLKLAGEQDTYPELEGRRINCWNALESRLRGWQTAYPESILPTIGLSDLHVMRARSPEPSQRDHAQVEEDQLARAVEILNSVPTTRRDPVWYTRYMRIATMQGWGNKRYGTLLETAAAAHPRHASIYRQAVLHYLPRSGGTAKDLDNLALLAVEKSGASEGMSMYVHVYDSVVFGWGGLWQRTRHETLMDWHKMRQGLQDVYQRYPVPWNLNRFAQHACLVHDMATLKVLLERIGDATQSVLHDGWQSGELARCRRLLKRLQAPEPDDTEKRT